MPSPAQSDRNLLGGVLALQMDFVTGDQLLAAMNAWALHKETPLLDLLRQDGALCIADHDALARLVERHLVRHGGDAGKSLAAVRLDAELRSMIEETKETGLGTNHGSLPSTATKSRGPSVSTPPGESRFRRIRSHAKGGLGEVFVAEDAELHREVALKEIQEHLADFEDSRTRFIREAEITGQLEHPGVVPIYGLGIYGDGRPYYAMRFIHGESLQESINRFHAADRAGRRDTGERTLALRGLLGRFVAVCNTVSYSHSRGIIHRDIKPANVMLGEFGETLVVDWGLARRMNEDETHTLSPLPIHLNPHTEQTQQGQAIGTPAFMPPEQALGDRHRIGPTSDIFSLGATLYNLLTGVPPYSGTGVLLQAAECSYAAPRQVNPGVPAALEAVCVKAMARQLDDRYSKARDLAADVDRWLGDEPVSAFREPVQTRLGRWGRHHKAQVAGAAVLLFTTVIGLASGLALLGHKQAEVVRERNAAQKARDHAEAIGNFYEHHVLAAARPKGWAGGTGKDVTLKEALDQAAPQIDHAFLGNPEVEAAVRNTLGQTYWFLGRFEDANPHLEAAYQLRLEQLGPEHPDTLTSLHNLAMQRWRQARLDDAVSLCRRAWETRRRVLGPEHEDTLFSQLNLGLFLYEGGDSQLDQSESLLRSGVEACKRVLGDDHHHTLYGQNDLALLLWWKGKTEESVELERQTFEGRRRSLGLDHPDTLRSMGNMAVSLVALGKLDEAEPLCKQCLEAKRRVLGPAHLETLWTEGTLGDLTIRKGNYVEAEKILRPYLEACLRSVGPNHPETLYARSLLGEMLTLAGRPTQAEPLLRECLNRREKTLSPRDSRICYTRVLLGQCLARQGKFAEAETLILAGHEGLTQVRHPQHRWIARTVDAIVEMYEKFGKPQQAEAWRKKRLASGK